MPTLPLPLFEKVYRNVDGVELSDKKERVLNAYLDEEGFTRGRPGLGLFSDLGLGANNAANSLFWWHDKNIALAVAGGRVFKIEYISGTAVKTDITGDSLSSNLPATFAADSSNCYIASGGKIVYTNGTALTAYIADVDCPTDVSHISYVDQYLLANDISANRIYYSDLSNPLSWNALSFFSPSGSPDSLVAQVAVNREIFIFGTTSLEIWTNDGSTPFARTPGGHLQSGLIAANSIIVDETTVYWLNHNRKFVKYYNGGYQNISSPYDKDIGMYSAVSDCRGFLMEIEGKKFLIWSFPTEDKTLVYNLAAQDWTEWSFWDQVSMEHTRFLGGSYCYSPAWGKHLVGDVNSSLVYEISPTFHDDAGAEIRVSVRTGHIDYGSSRRKVNRRILFRAKRGSHDVETEPKLMIRWRDDGANTWGNEHQFSLGNPGQTEMVVAIHRTGIYQARQYEFSVSDAVDVIFGRAEEEFTFLR